MYHFKIYIKPLKTQRRNHQECWDSLRRLIKLSAVYLPIPRFPSLLADTRSWYIARLEIWSRKLEHVCFFFNTPVFLFFSLCCPYTRLISSERVPSLLCQSYQGVYRSLPKSAVSNFHAQGIADYMFAWLTRLYPSYIPAHHTQNNHGGFAVVDSKIELNIMYHSITTNSRAQMYALFRITRFNILN